MTRPKVSIAALQSAPFTRARASASFFAQYPDFAVNLDAPIAEEFDVLALQQGWSTDKALAPYAQKWKSCFGPDIPVSWYKGIDNCCPHMFLDRYFGYEWERSDDVPFEVYFHIIADKEKWSNWTLSQKWKLCFGPNYIFWPVDLKDWLSHDHVLTIYHAVHERESDEKDGEKDGEMCLEDVDVFHHNGLEKPTNVFIVEACEVPDYWARFPDFIYLPEEPAVEEFERLALSMKWISCMLDLPKYYTAKCEEEWNNLVETIRKVNMQEGMESHVGLSGSPVRPVEMILRQTEKAAPKIPEVKEDSIEDSSTVEGENNSKHSSDWKKFVRTSCLASTCGKPSVKAGEVSLEQPTISQPIDLNKKVAHDNPYREIEELMEL